MFDEIVKKIAALGVPGLILIVVIGASGLTGAAALTFALAAIGPGGMIGGILTLGVVGLISEAIAEYGVDTLFSAVVQEHYRRGKSKDGLKAKISNYPISRKLKASLYEKLNRL